MKSLLLELTELQHTMALLSYRLLSYVGEITQDHVRWLLTILSTHRRSVDIQNVLKSLAEMAELSNEDLRSRSLARRRPAGTLALKKYYLPFLTSQLGFLSICAPEFQQKILQIKAQLDLLNADVDHYWFNYDKTFDHSITDVNRAAILDNIENCYRHIGSRAYDIASTISPILSQHGAKTAQSGA